jgi:predicted cytidylate kinase
MIITISGRPGSGKSTVARILAKKLGYRHYSMGDIRGRMALERGIDIDQFNSLAEKDPRIDAETDEYAEKLGREKNNFVMDTRMGFRFIPHSLKIYLDVERKEASRRIFSDRKNRPDEPHYKSPAEAAAVMDARMESDRKRYMKYYGVDCYDRSRYDIVIDTTKIRPGQVAEIIMRAIKERKKKRAISRQGSRSFWS